MSLSTESPEVSYQQQVDGDGSDIGSGHATHAAGHGGELEWDPEALGQVSEGAAAHAHSNTEYSEATSGTLAAHQCCDELLHHLLANSPTGGPLHSLTRPAVGISAPLPPLLFLFRRC